MSVFIAFGTDSKSQIVWQLGVTQHHYEAVVENNSLFTYIIVKYKLYWILEDINNTVRNCLSLSTRSDQDHIFSYVCKNRRETHLKIKSLSQFSLLLMSFFLLKGSPRVWSVYDLCMILLKYVYLYILLSEIWFSFEIVFNVFQKKVISTER